MGCVRFIHFSDLHLGRSLSFLRAHDDYELFKYFFNFISELASENDVEFFVLPGDIFNATVIDYKFKFLFSDFIKSNKERRIYLLPGNHDPYDERFYGFYKSHNNLIIFNKSDVTFYDERDVCVAGANLDFDNKGLVNPLKNFDKKSFKKPTIFLMHSNFTGIVSEHEDYFPIGINDLQGIETPFYLALGHIHKYYYEKEYHISVSYPGSPLPVRSNEIGEKYVNLVEFDGDDFLVNNIKTDFAIHKTDLVINKNCKIEDIYEYLSNNLSENVYYIVELKGVANDLLKWEISEAKNELMGEFLNIVDIKDSTKIPISTKDIGKKDIFYQILFEELKNEIEPLDNKLKNIAIKYELELDFDKLKQDALSYLLSNITREK